jgi:ubiquinone/menaquinone biosynthesis C-methylase UbiE
MKKHDKSTRNLFHKIHLGQIKNMAGYNKIRFSLNEKTLKVKKNYFKDKICADLGCGSTGAGGFNLLNLGAKFCYLMDMNKHIKKKIHVNLMEFKKKFKVDVGTLEKLPYKKNFFDFVLCQGVIHHMDKDLKGFEEIYRTLKVGGKSLIVVHGDGGIINDLTMKVIRPKYKNDKHFKNFVDSLLNKKFMKHKSFLIKNYDQQTKELFNYLLKFFDDDILLTMKDRILAPKYKTYNEKDLRILLKKIGFAKIYRIKKKVSFFNIRRLLAPIYHHYDNEISRALYGDGIIHLVVEK